MDTCYTHTRLHPQIKTFLFQHFATFTSIFRSVLGLLEIDYLSIALFNEQHELLLFSSKPSIEWNLIENDLWQFDSNYDIHFFDQGSVKSWPELYHEQWRDDLYYFKQKLPGLSFGFSVPSHFHHLNVIYSFATQSKHPKDIEHMLNNLNHLIRIGQFCLQKIMKSINLSEILNTNVGDRAFLKLVVNNEETV